MGASKNAFLGTVQDTRTSKVLAMFFMGISPTDNR